MDINSLLSDATKDTASPAQETRQFAAVSQSGQGQSKFSNPNPESVFRVDSPSTKKTSSKLVATFPQTTFQFVDGSAAPKSARDRELAISQRRSFAAKNAHNRRKMQAMANQIQIEEPIKQEFIIQMDQAQSIPTISFSIPEPRSNLETVTKKVSDQRSPISPMSLKAILQSTGDDEQSGKNATIIIDDRTRAEIVQRNRRYPSDLLVKLLRPPSDQVQHAFKHQDDRRIFDYWRARPAVEVTRYQMKYAHYWLEVFPKLAVSSSTIGNMVLASGYAHESMIPNTESRTKSLRALGHYRKGLQAMSKGTGYLTELELLTAAFFAFIYEDRQQNHKGALIHLKGCEAMSKQESPDESSELKDLKEYVNFILMCILTSTEKQARDQESSPVPTLRSSEAILQEVANMRDDIVDQLSLVVRLNQHVDVNKIRTMHTEWFNTLRLSERSNPEALNRNALFLLSNLFMGLCPASCYGASSYEEDANNWQGGLDTVRLYLTPEYQHDHYLLDELDLLITIEILAIHLARFVPNTSCRQQAESILRAITERRGILTTKIKTEPL